MSNELDEMALEYHRYPVPGKLTIQPTKKLANKRDLALAYSPGVAAACNLIADDPAEAANMTARGNLVAVISNGTAVLGLGAIGPLASKPVMEGKAVLFKKFAGVDVFDIEVDETDPDMLVEVVTRLEPTFGGINLEDIKAPECFIVERKCKERMNIPVFHDDQHGTAICVGAAVYNALRLQNKDPEQVRVVASGAGAAALASLHLLVSLGIPKHNITVCDRSGVVHKGRADEMDEFKAEFAVDTDARTLDDAIEGADVFIGLSGPGVLNQDMVKKMADGPLIMALANPTPEILPEEALEARSDAIIATGRSDYPNQVNNVLCFPFLFRGALDVGATEINEEMKVACVKAIGDLAMAEPSDVVARAYLGESLSFGPEYILPKPFDPRLILEIAPAVAKAAMDSGVATRPIEDFKAYRKRLTQFVYRSGQAMQPIFEQAQSNPKRVVYAEGEDERVLQAVQIVLDDGLAIPTLIGKRERIERRIKDLGLRFKLDEQVELIDPRDNQYFQKHVEAFLRKNARKGVTPSLARDMVSTRSTLIASLAVELGDADGMICGTFGPFATHLDTIRSVIPLADGVTECHALQVLLTEKGSLFIADTNVMCDPTVEELAEIATLGAQAVKRFGLIPRVALVSHSNFGASNHPSAQKMRDALALIREQAPDLMIDGEMHGDAALSDAVRANIISDSPLEGAANLLVMPNLDAANATFNVAKIMTDGLSVGPILIGMSRPAHIVTPSITVRGMVNMSALTVAHANEMVT